MALNGKTILITGAAVRVGRSLALAAAAAGADIVLHYRSSEKEAEETAAEIRDLGVSAHLVQADLSNPTEIHRLMDEALADTPLYGLVNSASIFENKELAETDLATWQRHMQVNLTAPFLLAQRFAAAAGSAEGRIINLLDWRALRPGADHFAYTVSKAGLAALTRSLAVALAPNITVNGLAFGAILPPSDGGNTSKVIQNVPAGRWAQEDEPGRALLFLLDGPTYVTGEVIHLDGGRHLV
ncbi:MAG: SDR family oxidoreductase [Anaerolineae bacterium]|nr:MAG: SDR family oxidoreductase [Anaerolineae bacterium]